MKRQRLALAVVERPLNSQWRACRVAYHYHGPLQLKGQQQIVQCLRHPRQGERVTVGARGKAMAGQVRVQNRRRRMQGGDELGPGMGRGPGAVQQQQGGLSRRALAALGRVVLHMPVKGADGHGPAGLPMGPVTGQARWGRTRPKKII